MPNSTKPFWETKTLAEMTKAEWESLCDGCGNCCVCILHNEETGDVFETDVACQLYEPKSRRCRDYANRSIRVPDCVTLTADNVGALYWMPKTCAYRLIEEGKPLPDWHPLITGDPTSVDRAGIAAKPAIIADGDFDDDELESRITKTR